MNRRNFLKFLGLSTAATLVKPAQYGMTVTLTDDHIYPSGDWRDGMVERCAAEMAAFDKAGWEHMKQEAAQKNCRTIGRVSPRPVGRIRVKTNLYFH